MLSFYYTKEIFLCGLLLLPAAFACSDEWIQHQVEKSNSSLAARWFRIANGPYVHGQFWEDNRIPFCLDVNYPELRTTVVPLLKKAWDLWLAAGVDNRIVFEQGTAAECADGSGVHVLTITSSNAGTLFCTTGDRPGGATTRGSVMIIDASVLGQYPIGPEGALAHEIGHAWGLLHEHQRPDMWPPFPYNGNGRQEINFYCNNLRDYDEMMTPGDPGTGRPFTQEELDTTLCLSATRANRAHFSASQYLPDLDPTRSYPRGDLDWDSIMIYGPGAGAKPGTLVMKRPNGIPIQYNANPSQKDVQNLMAMYPPSGKRKNPLMYFSKGSPLQGAFKKITGGHAECDEEPLDG